MAIKFQQLSNDAGYLIGQRDVLITAEGEEELTHYEYTYDEHGNVTGIEGYETTDTKEGIKELKSASFIYDGENRLIKYNGEDVRYDAKGNMVYGPVDGVMTELTYDCRNRLLRAGDNVYTYDAENVRIAVETSRERTEIVTDSFRLWERRQVLWMHISMLTWIMTTSMLHFHWFVQQARPQEIPSGS